MAKRKGLSKKLRFEIFKRDSFACQYCGHTVPQVTLEIDHINPVSKGGGNEPENLITACYDCNRGKGATELTKIPESLSDKFERDQEKHDQIVEFGKFFEIKKKYEEKQIVDIGHYFFNGYEDEQDTYIFNKKHASSIAVILKSLPISEVYEAIDITHAKGITSQHSAIKYFYAICRNKKNGTKKPDHYEN